jgi:hypothetical protein
MPIFRRKLAKIAENCDHHIDPKSERLEKKTHRLFTVVYRKPEISVLKQGDHNQTLSQTAFCKI